MGGPSGTVTFLFTEIEGSTRLWERAPSAMRAALEAKVAAHLDALDPAVRDDNLAIGARLDRRGFIRLIAEAERLAASGLPPLQPAPPGPA